MRQRIYEIAVVNASELEGIIFEQEVYLDVIGYPTDAGYPR